jgi:two-component system OmpR family sensor kinase
MPRLFWKFFAIIWLTLAGSVAVTLATVNLLEIAPHVRKLDNKLREHGVTLTANVLQMEGEDAARRLVRASEATVPLGLTISKTPASGDCAGEATAEAKSILRDGMCYQVSVPSRANVLLDNIGIMVPWFAILVASTLSAAALARYLIGPVVHLRDGLSALAHGRFEVRIGHNMACRRDEITALAHDFDATAARLQELQDAQQRLFHDVSHELRSPLSRLQAAVGVLRQSPAKLDAMLDRMDREVERLDTLVGEVLTLARLTAGARLPLTTQTLNIIDLLNEILSDAAFEAQARQVRITTSVDGIFLANVDGELIYRAFENVVRNAVKYTEECSRVSVHCEATADLLKVWVADQGPGVRGDELERIFQPFSRGQDAVPKGGYGLGLAIARQAVERHGGRVYASQRDVGGLVVILELPRKPTMPGPVDVQG